MNRVRPGSYWFRVVAVAALLVLPPTVRADPAAGGVVHRWEWVGAYDGLLTCLADSTLWFNSPDGVLHRRDLSVPGSPAPASGPGWSAVAPPRGFQPGRLAIGPDGTLHLIGRYPRSRKGILLTSPQGPAPRWTEIPVPSLGSLYDIQVVADGTIWLAGERREVFHGRGGTWVKELTPLPYHNFQMRMFDDGGGWIVAETRALSAVYYRAGGRWHTALQGAGEYALLHASPGAALVVTNEGVVRVPRPGAGPPALLPGIPPAERAEVAFQDSTTGWIVQDGVLSRIASGRLEPVPLEASPQRVRSIFAPGDGRLYSTDGTGGLYVLESGAHTAPDPVFPLRLRQHASWLNTSRIHGVAVLRVKDEELLYLVNHEDQNPTLRLDFRRDDSAPFDRDAWKRFSQPFRNAGPDRTADWRYPYDVAAVTADFNGDGLEDIVLVGLYMGCRLYRNVRDEHFVDWTAEARIGGDLMDHAAGVGVLDADADGDLDLYIANFLVPDRLYVNNGAAQFTEDAAGAGIRTRDSSGMVACADLDDDGDSDIAVSTWGRGLLLHENLGPAGRGPRFRTRVLFVDQPGEAADEGLATQYVNGIGLADLDGDRLPEMVLTSPVGPPRFYRNDGGLRFREDPGYLVDPSPAVPAEGVSFGDLDHDGDLDMVLTGPATGRFFENRGDRMTAVPLGTSFADSAQVRTVGAALLDFEGDGDLDVAMSADGAQFLFYQNERNDGRSIELRVEGPPANRSAVGARVSLRPEGTGDGPGAGVQARVIPGATSYGSCDSKQLHFGGIGEGRRYEAVIELAGARTLRLPGLVKGDRRTVRLAAGSAAPLTAGFVPPVQRFFGDPWNRRWAGGTLLATLVVLGLSLLLFPSRERPWRWLPVVAAVPVAAALLYRALALDPGLVLSLVAAGAPALLAGGVLVLVRARSRTGPAHDLVLNLSDLLRAFRHNGPPRKALDSLRLTLNNLPERIDATWSEILLEDFRSYQTVVLPQLRAMSRMARSAALPGGDIEALLRRQEERLPAWHRMVAAGADGRALPPGLAQGLETLGRSLSQVGDWLERTRVETDRRLALDLCDSLQRYVESRRRLVPVAIRLDAPEPPGPSVRCRREDLEHLLDVLLDNAVAAMEDSTVRQVSIRGWVESPATARIRFVDSGLGIADAVRGRLFERGVSTSGRPSRGMGLHYARRIVERYGGRIESVDGDTPGACFEIEMEIVPARAGEAVR